MTKIPLNQAGDYFEKKFSDLITAATLESERRLKLESPVDTGRFRSNWQTTIEKRQGSVTNNLPYSERLAAGWSKQAPAGWVFMIAKDIQSYVNRVVSDLGS
jgi:hypothetical protein